MSSNLIDNVRELRVREQEKGMQVKRIIHINITFSVKCLTSLLTKYRIFRHSLENSQNQNWIGTFCYTNSLIEDSLT